MTIPDTIIEKLQLSQTGEQVGRSFYYNLRVFKSDLDGFANMIFAECDLNGNHSEYVHWVNHKTKRYGSITVEFLQDQSIETIKKVLR